MFSYVCATSSFRRVKAPKAPKAKETWMVFPTTWINLIHKLPASVETITLHNSSSGLSHREATDLITVLLKLAEAKSWRLPKLRGLYLINMTAKTPHPEWASKQVLQQSVDPHPEAKLTTQAEHGSDKERRQSGIQHWCTELRRVAAENGVELHISEAYVGSKSMKCCRRLVLSDRLST